MNENTKNALEWWNGLDDLGKDSWIMFECPTKNQDSITTEEIEGLYRCRMEVIDDN